MKKKKKRMKMKTTFKRTMTSMSMYGPKDPLI